ncbi:MAG: ECF RNA polymerase sigma-E factor [Cellvibrionales bacterium UBA7375]|nr:RNA polymerase sigma factor RpoE [Porticoccaceae bacterium]RPG83949.1 MAG: RNA polymerase sigma factor RpoE [Cellvibrionales bacterium TMED47]CAI8326589.1 MAG: ECF RNA polymerase sigma-E factor [Cellvibrionales bacterium UBA7375]|tara:strand:- start:6460 stop:7050 length:591 start_codon:yes stop_codon:yes gene_type:complete
MKEHNSEPTDHQLVLRVQKGDKRAFDLLVLKYQYKLQAIVGRFIRDTDEVADVTQEAFIKAYKALPRFRGDSQFYTWLYRIAINTAKNYLVSKSRRPANTDIDVEDAEQFSNNEKLIDDTSPESSMMTDELAAIIKSALSSLPEDLRTALTLREFEGMSYEDIAVVMNCPVGTVRSRIFRAREFLDERVLSMTNKS